MKTAIKVKTKREHHLRTGQRYYALFRMVAKKYQNPFGELFTVPGDEWKINEEETLVAQFVKILNSPSEVAECVRREPGSRYSVVFGTFSTIEPHIQVFMSGMNMNTIEAEGWDDPA